MSQRPISALVLDTMNCSGIEAPSPTYRNTMLLLLVVGCCWRCKVVVVLVVGVGVVAVLQLCCCGTPMLR
jgi:hypothetical protein